MRRGMGLSEQNVEKVRLPTVPGKSPGIVGWEPQVVLQCRECGVLYEGTNGPKRRGYDIQRSGFFFHACEGRTGMRRCPDCLAKVEAACPNTGRHQ